jgi:hypothetical protein
MILSMELQDYVTFFLYFYSCLYNTKYNINIILFLYKKLHKYYRKIDYTNFVHANEKYFI